MTNTANTTVVLNSDNTDNVDIQPIVDNALIGDFSGYIGADVSIKAKVRNALKAGMMDAVGQMDSIEANRYMVALNGATGSKAAKAAKPVNHAEIVAKRAYVLIMAGNALLGGTVPKGLNPADVDNAAVNAAFEAIDGEGLEKDIEDIATQKITKSGERTDIGAHIAMVIEGAESGTFFSVRKIASTSTDAAPNGCPSDGAVAMRLFPQNGEESTLVGLLPIRPVSPDNGDDVPVKGLIVL